MTKCEEGPKSRFTSFLICLLVLPGADMGPMGAEHSSMPSQPNLLATPISVQHKGKEGVASEYKEAHVVPRSTDEA